MSEVLADTINDICPLCASALVCIGLIFSSRVTWKQQSGGRQVAFKSKKQLGARMVIGQEMGKDFPPEIKYLLNEMIFK